MLEKVKKLAELIEKEQIQSLQKRDLACDGNIKNAKTSIKVGRKYINIDVGDSGKYMIEMETGIIYGIKGYGKVHKGYKFGTLDTIDKYYWGEYRAIPKKL